jgi:hypothetical protein
MRSWSRHAGVIALCLAQCMLAACSGNGLIGNVYRGDGFAFTVVEPGGSWQRVNVTKAALEYRHDGSQATILVNARCGLDGDDVPLQSLTQHLFMQFTEEEIKSQDVVPFDGREAMHTVIDAKLDGVALRYDVWVLKKDGCVYDLLYLAPAGSFDGGRAAFDELVRGFSTVDMPDD